MNPILRTALSVFGWTIYWCIALIVLGLAFLYYGRDWPEFEGIIDYLMRML